MLNKLSNKTLHAETLNATKSEKAATVVLLKYLAEVSQRKLFIEYGHSTLHKYITSELGYSESEAWTRIQAMKLIKAAPGVEEKIESGEMNLCNASILNMHFKNENITPDSPEGKEAIKKAEELPTRKLKNALTKEPPKEKRITLHERLLKKLKKLQDSWHDSSELELIESLIDEKIREIELSKSKHTSKSDPEKKTRYIPISTKREILERSRNQCEHINPNGTRCQERRFLELDHIKPYALGGNRSPENLRILCRNHNQRRAIVSFGNCNMNLKVLQPIPSEIR